MTIIYAVSGVLILTGAFFCFTAALGVLRLPDVYTRMHAATKAATLGAAFLFLALGLTSLDVSVAAKSVIGIAFFLVTAPISSHLLGRAAYRTKTPLYERTLGDDLQGRYGADGALKGNLNPSSRPERPD